VTTQLKINEMLRLLILRPRWTALSFSTGRTSPVFISDL